MLVRDTLPHLDPVDEQIVIQRDWSAPINSPPIKLMDGGLKAEWDAFNEKLMDMEAQQRSGANLLLTTEELGVEEEAPAGDEDDEEGVGDDTTHQPFLNIQRQNSLLAGSAVGLAAPEEPQLDEPARKEIKLEDGVETKNDGRRGDTAYAGGSLTLGERDNHKTP